MRPTVSNRRPAMDRRDRHPPDPAAARRRSLNTAPLWPSLLSMTCLCGSLLLLVSWLLQPPSPDRPSRSVSRDRPLGILVSSTLPSLPESLAPVIQWLQPKTDTEVEALIQRLYDQGAAEPWNLAGVPLELQREILDRGQREPQLLALANWYKVRDRLSQDLLPPDPPAKPGRWASLTRALGFPQTQVSVTLTASSGVSAGAEAADGAGASASAAGDSTSPPSAAEPPAANGPDPGATQAAATQALKALAEVELRLQQEKLAHQTWNQARVAALKAVAQGEVVPPTVASWEAAAVQWQESIQWLEQVPPESLWGPLAADRQVTYHNNLKIARYAAAELKPNPLKTAAQRHNLGNRTTLSVCQLGGDCRHLRGDVPIVRPASLSKIPIALALMMELKAKNIALGTKVNVSRGNNTEDGGEVRTGRTYTLEALVQDMLANSSNVASNQLIDYLGWENIAKNLKARGYNTSRVTFKFVGVQMMPSQPGTQANVLTAQELTDMVRDLYNEDYGGRGAVLEALGNQADRELGYAALQGTAAQWLGEKTGRTSETTGTTVIFSLEGQTYVLSLLDQAGLSDLTIQQILRDIVAEISTDPEF